MVKKTISEYILIPLFLILLIIPFALSDTQTQKSCNLEGTSCCTNPGDIYDYSADVCCPPDSPYFFPPNVCRMTPASGTADNYYTRLAECHGAKDPAGNCIYYDSSYWGV